MEKIVHTQREFFDSNRTKDFGFRKSQLKKLKEVLASNESTLFDAISQDFGRSEFETYLAELSILYHDIDEYIKKMNSWGKPHKVRTNLVNFPASSYIVPEPLGVTLVIGAWNYPYQLSLAPAIASLAAGNTVILKPSEISSSTSRVMAKVINENFDPNYFHVIEGGVEETTQLLKCRFDKIFYTGSTTVGKIIYKAAAEHLTPVTLEMGGKSPTFVTKDCNLKMCVKRLVWAKFLNAGQTCIAPDYVLLDKSIELEFLDLLKKEIVKNQYSIENQNYVQIINQRNFQRLSRFLKPNQIYFGGTAHEEQRTIDPTILVNVSLEDEVMNEEIFGPILPILPYENIDEAISYVKSGEKPLACYLFTSNKSLKRKIVQEISFGGGAINDAMMHISNPRLPFGGVGASGMGSYHGKAGFDAFSHHKSILNKPTWIETSIKYTPYLPWKKRLVQWLIG